jgi:hypothetical protein
MRPPGPSIKRLMAIVVVGALDLGAGRALFVYNPMMLIGVAVTALALQVSVYALIRTQGRVRSFCVGFLTFGSLGMVLFISAMAFPRSIGIAIDPNTGKRVRLELAGSPMWYVLEDYDRFALEAVLRRPFLRDVVMKAEVNQKTYLVLIWTLPQLLLGLVGGLLAYRIAWMLANRRRAARIDL